MNQDDRDFEFLLLSNMTRGLYRENMFIADRTRMNPSYHERMSADETNRDIVIQRAPARSNVKWNRCRIKRHISPEIIRE